MRLLMVLAPFVFLLAACGWGGESAPAAEDNSGPGTYIALGDSLSEGVGASDQKATAFVPLVHRGLGEGWTLVNLGHSGDTSAQLIEHGHLDEAIALIEVGKSDDDPANDVNLVTLEIGGNDLLDTYFEMVVRGACPSVTESLQRPQCVELLDALASYRPNLRETLARIRAADPDVPISLMTFYNLFSLFPGRDLDGDGSVSGLEGDERTLDELGELLLEGDRGTTFPEGINDMIRSEGAAAGATVVDWRPIFDGSESALITMDLIHPNDEGYRLMAEAVLDAVHDDGVAVADG